MSPGRLRVVHTELWIRGRVLTPGREGLIMPIIALMIVREGEFGG